MKFLRRTGFLIMLALFLWLLFDRVFNLGYDTCEWDYDETNYWEGWT